MGSFLSHIEEQGRTLRCYGHKFVEQHSLDVAVARKSAAEVCQGACALFASIRQSTDGHDK
eukprot:257268-Pelagomonas_calceolata.AAC.7